jgi:hypothetical protein
MFLKFVRITNATIGGFVIGYFVTERVIDLFDESMNTTNRRIISSIVGIPLGVYGFNLAVQKN